MKSNFLTKKTIGYSYGLEENLFEAIGIMMTIGLRYEVKCLQKLLSHPLPDPLNLRPTI